MKTGIVKFYISMYIRIHQSPIPRMISAYEDSNVKTFRETDTDLILYYKESMRSGSEN